jgi:hypothetical protein
LGPKINMVVRHIHRSGILHGARKYILLGVKKAKIGAQSPKTEFGAQIHKILHGVRKHILLGVKKAKISKISFRTKKIKTSRHFKKCMLKSLCRTQKKKTS